VALDALVRANVSSLADLAEAWDGKSDPGVGGGKGVVGEEGEGCGSNPLYLALFQDCIMPESKLQPCVVSIDPVPTSCCFSQPAESANPPPLYPSTHTLPCSKEVMGIEPLIGGAARVWGLEGGG